MISPRRMKANDRLIKMCAYRKLKNQKKNISGETRENSYIISGKKETHLDLNVCEDTNSTKTSVRIKILP